MKLILNVEKGFSAEKLEADMENFKKRVMYCQYGLTLRQIYPSTKALKVMIDVIPEDQINSGN